MSRTAKAEDIKRAEDFLKSVFRKQKRPTVNCVLKHVSSSGMQRQITFLVADKGEVRNINWAICTLMNYRLGKRDGVVVNGCGMDMGFHVVNSLSQRLYCPKEYDHDAAYKLHSEWV